MNILFLTVNHEDYLSDSLFHGLRKIYGCNVVDFPKKSSMYKTVNIPNNKIYGNGFSLYKTLDNIEVDRRDIREKIINNFFNFIVFSNFSEQFGYYLTYYQFLNSQNTVIIDGDDSPKIFPFYGKYWRKFPFQFLHFSYSNILTFKREWTPKTLKYKSYFMLPQRLCEILYKKMPLHKISFSIPEEKIIGIFNTKEKLFPMHIVDAEITNKLQSSSLSYAFSNEKEYYHDLAISKFGITTMRAGWDCMRHYEIAGNGTVICFRNLNLKPEMCAPHDLIPGINCISYESYDDLMFQIENLSIGEYEKLQTNSLEWVKNKTTEVVASYFIQKIKNHSSFKI